MSDFSIVVENILKEREKIRSLLFLGEKEVTRTLLINREETTGSYGDEVYFCLFGVKSFKLVIKLNYSYTVVNANKLKPNYS